MPLPGGNAEASRVLVRDQAYRAIKEAILQGQLLPGERLDDRELQQWLGVSATPVRQALYALTLEGLVETAPQAYTRVVTPKPEQAMEHLQAIGVLALGITKLTFPTLAEDQRRQLVTLLEQTLERLQAHDLEGAVRASDEYHRALVDHCPNAALVRLAEHAGIALAYYVTIAYQAIDIDWDETIQGYHELIDGFRRGARDQVARSVSRLFHLEPPATVSVPAAGEADPLA